MEQTSPSIVQQSAPDQPAETQVAALPSTDNPDELYRNSYEFILSGDYGTAETGFRDHISRFPENQKAADAHFWLGEAQLGQKKYRDAAEMFLAANKQYPSAKKAPDMLLKLGVSLVGLDQRDVACATFTRNRQALSVDFRRAQGTRQAGTGSGRLLTALPGRDLSGLFSSFDITSRGSVIAAVSGGSDSTALLLLLNDHLSRQAPQTRLVAVTVDHALQTGIGRGSRRSRAPLRNARHHHIARSSGPAPNPRPVSLPPPGKRARAAG